MPDSEALILGMPLLEKFPEGWTPVEGVALVKALNENGKVTMFMSATPDLNTWEAIGMVTDAMDQLRDGLRESGDDD